MRWIESPPSATEIRAHVEGRILAAADELPESLIGKDAESIASAVFEGPLGFWEGEVLQYIADDAGVRAAAAEAEKQIAAARVEFLRDPRVLGALTACEQTPDICALLAAAKAAELPLPPADIAELEREWAGRLQGGPALHFEAAELAGTPPGMFADGEVQMTLPHVFTVLRHCTNGATRRAVYSAFLGRGGVENEECLARIARRRHEFAKTAGFGSYAEYALRHGRRMMSSLGEVEQALAYRAPEGESEATQFARENLAETVTLVDSPPRIETCDSEFVKTRMAPKEALDLPVRDEMARRAAHWYAGAFGLSAASVVVKGCPGVELSRDGVVAGTIVYDIAPREGKFGGVATALARVESPAVAVVLASFGKQLNPMFARALFHETGHAVHYILAAPRTLGPFCDLAADYVEAPAIMFEQFLQDPVVLGALGISESAARAFKPPPGELASHTITARFDLELHGTNPPVDAEGVVETFTRIRREVLGYEPEAYTCHRGRNLAHIAFGDYVAGYYAYPWGTILGQRLYARYKNDLAAFEVEVLSKGGRFVVPKTLLSTTD